MKASGDFIRGRGGYSYVFKQPTAREEEALCKKAMEGCPVEAIATIAKAECDRAGDDSAEMREKLSGNAQTRRSSTDPATVGYRTSPIKSDFGIDCSPDSN
jgi:hypothetical protein